LRVLTLFESQPAGARRRKNKNENPKRNGTPQVGKGGCGSLFSGMAGLILSVFPRLSGDKKGACLLKNRGLRKKGGRGLLEEENSVMGKKGASNQSDAHRTPAKGHTNGTRPTPRGGGVAKSPLRMCKYKGRLSNPGWRFSVKRFLSLTRHSSCHCGPAAAVIVRAPVS
jgi:hypothetical protein